MESKIMGKVNAAPDNSKNVLKLISLFVGELVFLAVLFLLIRCLDSSLDAGWFYNSGSTMVVCFAIFGTLLITGLLPDFLRSFVYTLKQREEVTAVQVKKSLLSVNTAMAAAVAADLLVLVYSYILAMATTWSNSADDLARTMPLSLAILGSCAVSGLLAVIILLPVSVRLKARLISMQTEQ